MTPLNKSPYLRVQRHFPQDTSQALSVELDKSYVDIAQKMNDRTIGTFATGNPIVTGEKWYPEGPNGQQTVRQLYMVSGTGNIPHGINLSQIAGFSRCWGQYTDGTNWYGLVFASNTTIAGQVTFYITPTNIVIQAGSGAPSVTGGSVILEWLAQMSQG